MVLSVGTPLSLLSLGASSQRLAPQELDGRAARLEFRDVCRVASSPVPETPLPLCAVELKEPGP